jgi:bacterioferritin-associated ferredoxin
MYVCHCRGITDRTIKAAVAAGADTVEDVARTCGAGADCGGCWPALDELIEEIAERTPVLGGRGGLGGHHAA